MKLQRLEAIRKLYFSLPLVPRDCPLCGGKSGSLLVRRDRYFLPIDVVECTDCGFVHASRNLDREGARQFYTSIYPWLIYRRPRAEAEYDLQKREQAAFRWQRILARIDRPDSVFELGCGDGHFLAEARRLGISQLAAVEPDSSSRAHIIASLGPETDLWGDLSDVPQQPLKSQLIAMFHVLEHL
ncbi:MAG: hypothetical protein KKB63_16015, partial [Alphaproteobacteria bacterium]|nr:hypothetical protein [Alphaproteobacteria bacterium]